MYKEFWQDKYPEVIPAEIDVNAYSSVLDVFHESCEKFADKPAFTNMGKTLTYREVNQLSAQFAAYLQSIPDLNPGDRIAVQLPNTLQYPIIIFGIIRAGFIVVNTNPMYTLREMEHQFNDAEVKVVICLSTTAHMVQEVLSHTGIKHVIVSEISDFLPPIKRFITNFIVKNVKKLIKPYQIANKVSFREALAIGANKSFKEITPNPEDVTILQYTGGTTGIAKGASLTHRNLVANMMQSKYFMGVGLSEGTEIVVSPLPLYHIYSFTIHCMVVMVLGGHNILITDPRNLKGLISDVAKYPFTVFVGLNTLFASLCNNEDFKKLDFSNLKLSLSGGMALQPATNERWQQLTGCQICEGYGMTEASPVISANPPLPNWVKTGCIGLPLPSTQCKIVDNDGNEVPIGECGELCIKGPQVMKGYWNKPEETAEVIDSDGWLHTGDIAIAREDGYLSIVDRKKDMIVVSGFNVYPNEVEDVAVQIEGVLHTAAIGIPDEKSGEAVKLFIVVKPDTVLTRDEVMKYMKNNLTGYKRPKYIEFRDSIPMTNVGKVLRKELRAEELKKLAEK